jgi:hypothetical protein
MPAWLKLLRFLAKDINSALDLVLILSDSYLGMLVWLHDTLPYKLVGQNKTLIARICCGVGPLLEGSSGWTGLASTRTSPGTKVLAGGGEGAAFSFSGIPNCWLASCLSCSHN